MSTDEIYSIAPCLKSGLLSNVGMEMVNEVKKLQKNSVSDILKTLVAYNLYKFREGILEMDEDPRALSLEYFQKQIKFLKSCNNFNDNLFFKDYSFNQSLDFGERNYNKTGEYYASLFEDFGAESYFNEATEILKERLEKNQIFPDNLESKTVLDAGCGGGKYSGAWKKLGAEKVVGVDFSEHIIKDTRERIQRANLEVDFYVEDVLNLSFKDNSFDIVYCNGVLHHSTQGKKGISELIRVLKKGGMGWLYLIEDPGGFFWDIIEIIRLFMHDVDVHVAQETLKLLNLPPNKIFRILDHSLVPVNIRWTKEEVYNALHESGAKDIKRLKRGTHFDRIEQIYNDIPFAKLKYGDGENYFVFSK